MVRQSMCPKAMSDFCSSTIVFIDALTMSKMEFNFFLELLTRNKNVIYQYLAHRSREGDCITAWCISDEKHLF